MAGIEKALADANFKSLLKQAGNAYSVEVVDEFLTPVVHVKVGEVSHEFPLEKLGYYFSDGSGKFYSLEDDNEVRPQDIADTAIEAHLQADLGKKLGGK